jgi:co-chaperonin GroES (HSP10)
MNIEYNSKEREFLNQALVKPFGIRVVIDADKVPETTTGGLYVPPGLEHMTAARTLTGTVLAAGENVTDMLRPGDRVLYSEYSFKRLSGITGFPSDTGQIVILADQIIGKVLFNEVKLGGNCHA